MATENSAILWRRLDTPGHDACRLIRLDDGWRLQGSAAFLHEDGSPACACYEVDCDREWRTRRGRVRGSIGARNLDLHIERADDGQWRLDGKAVDGMDGLLDLDLGFTPATNLLQLRRIALDTGQTADVPVAWLDLPERGLRMLQQRYERRARGAYWYEAPEYGYSALLRVNVLGFVEDYPQLWRMEARDGNPPAD